MNNLKPNNKRGKNAIFLIWIILGSFLVTLVLAFTSGILSSISSSYTEENSVVLTLIHIADRAIIFTDYLIIVLFIISIVTFILWFRRAYYNLRLFSGTTELGNGWAAGVWFVPIMNLVVPYQMMKEMYIKTDRYLLIENTEEYQNKRLKVTTVNWWWSLWIGTMILKQVTSRLARFNNLTTSDDILVNSFLSLLLLLLYLGLCVATMKLIKNYMRVEKILFQTFNLK